MIVVDSDALMLAGAVALILWTHIRSGEAERKFDDECRREARRRREKEALKEKRLAWRPPLWPHPSPPWKSAP